MYIMYIILYTFTMIPGSWHEVTIYPATAQHFGPNLGRLRMVETWQFTKRRTPEIWSQMATTYVYVSMIYVCMRAM